MSSTPQPQMSPPTPTAPSTSTSAASSSAPPRPSSDVKLPPIRSLPHFDDHLRSSSSSSSMQKLPSLDASSSSSPRGTHLSRPPLDDSADAERGAMPSDAAGAGTSTGAGAGAGASQQRFAHPFFDAGRPSKPLEERRGSPNEMESRLAHALHDLKAAQAALEHAMTPVETAQPSQEAINSARDAAGQAWYVLNSLSDRPVHNPPSSTAIMYPRQQTRGPVPSSESSSSAAGADSPHKTTASTAAAPSSSAHWSQQQATATGANDGRRGGEGEGAAPSGHHRPPPSYLPPVDSIWGLNKRTHPFPPPPSASTAPPDQPRLAYEGQDPEHDDGHPRPPVPIFRAGDHSYPPQGIKAPRPPSRSQTSYAPLCQQAPPSSREGERSYMYAPASIRNRLAAMRKGPSPPPPQAQPPMPAHSMETPPASIYHPMSSMSPYGVHGPPPPLSQPHDGYPAGPSAAGSLWQDPRGGMAMPHPLHANPSAAQQAAAAEAAEEERRNSLEGPNKYKKRSRAPAPSSCKNCGTNETPEWRRGPDGARTLCNACGLHFAKMVKKRGPAHPDGPSALPEDEMGYQHGGGHPPSMLPPPPPHHLQYQHHAPPHHPHDARMMYGPEGAQQQQQLTLPPPPGSAGHHGAPR